MTVKDHEIREYINDLRDIALEFHATQQLRQRIHDLVMHMIKRVREDVDDYNSRRAPYIILKYDSHHDLSYAVIRLMREGYMLSGNLIWNEKCLEYIQAMSLPTNLQDAS